MRFAGFFCFLAALFAIGDAVERKSLRMRSRTRLRTRSKDSMAPPVILLVSSPMERKICYTMIDNFVAVGNQVRALVDSGLNSPYGVAWDKDNRAIFVSDFGLKKIFRYEVQVRRKSGFVFPYKMTVIGEKVTIVENVECKWLTVRDKNLFYSDEATKSINMVNDFTIKQLVKGEIQPSDLASVSEQTAEALAEADAAEKLQATAAQKKGDKPGVSDAPAIKTLYQSDANPHIGTPAGLYADGQDLYWVNVQDGTEKGTIVRGSMFPTAPLDESSESGAPTFATEALSNNSASAFGVTETFSMLLYTAGGRNVYAVPRSRQGDPVVMTENLEGSRGIVWDGDQTAYVADQEGSAIYSLPVGRMEPGQPTAKAVDFHDCYGLDIVHLEPSLVDPEDQLTAHLKASAASQVDAAQDVHAAAQEQAVAAGDAAVSATPELEFPAGLGTGSGTEGAEAEQAQSAQSAQSGSEGGIWQTVDDTIKFFTG